MKSRLRERGMRDTKNALITLEIIVLLKTVLSLNCEFVIVQFSGFKNLN